MNKNILAFILLCCGTLVACGDNVTVSTQAQRDEAILAQYFKENNLNPTKHPTGFYYTITKTNGATKPVNGDSILFHYEGRTIYGKVFDNSRYYAKPDSLGFRLGITSNVFPEKGGFSPYAGLLINNKSFQDATRLLGEKESGIFYFPSTLLFGSKGYSVLLPPNSVVALNIDVLKIKPQ
jgi:FKBP-type peptidyl-prolyl cis-trans isomerase